MTKVCLARDCDHAVARELGYHRLRCIVKIVHIGAYRIHTAPLFVPDQTHQAFEHTSSEQLSMIVKACHGGLSNTYQCFFIGFLPVLGKRVPVYRCQRCLGKGRENLLLDIWRDRETVIGDVSARQVARQAHECREQRFRIVRVVFERGQHFFIRIKRLVRDLDRTPVFADLTRADMRDQIGEGLSREGLAMARRSLSPESTRIGTG